MQFLLYLLRWQDVNLELLVAISQTINSKQRKPKSRGGETYISDDLKLGPKTGIFPLPEPANQSVYA